MDPLLKIVQGWLSGGGLPTVSRGFLERIDPTAPPEQVFQQILDNYFITQSSHAWKHKPIRLSYETMREIADRNPIVGSIINARINQVASFSNPLSLMERTSALPLGYRVHHREKGDGELTSDDRIQQRQIEQFIWNTGTTPRVRNGERRPTFDQWIKMSVRDSLTYDQMCSEIVPSRSGKIVEFWPVDASTIRRASVKGEPIPRIYSEEVKGGAFVQMIGSRVENVYTPQEMIFGVRNPQTDIESNGYGRGEVEMLTGTVISLLAGIEHNSRFFDQGAAIKGILNIKGEVASQPHFESYKREWLAQVTGARNAWKTPLMQSPQGIEFINLHGNNRDMEFSQWIDLLVRATASVYLIDPSEIGFHLGKNSYGERDAKFESHPFEVRLKMSKSKGLRPLLSFMAQTINGHIMRRNFPQWIFSFSGMDLRDEKEAIALRVQEGRTYKSIDEVRAEAGLEPLGEKGLGHLILNREHCAGVRAKKRRRRRRKVG